MHKPACMQWLGAGETLNFEPTVLIVEDNLDDERLTLRALKRSGISTTTVVVRDGEQACEYLFDANIHLPDCVLLDLKLPKLSGHEVLERIRANERTKNLRVVVFSSSGEHFDILHSYNLGASSYVQKPVGFEQFMQTGASLAQYWMNLNRSPVALEG